MKDKLGKKEGRINVNLDRAKTRGHLLSICGKERRKKGRRVTKRSRTMGTKGSIYLVKDRMRYFGQRKIRIVRNGGKEVSYSFRRGSRTSNPQASRGQRKNCQGQIRERPYV